MLRWRLLLLLRSSTVIAVYLLKDPLSTGEGAVKGLQSVPPKQLFMHCELQSMHGPLFFTAVLVAAG